MSDFALLAISKIVDCDSRTEAKCSYIYSDNSYYLFEYYNGIC